MFVGLAVGVGKVEASCSVSVSPNNVVMGVSSVSQFAISNTGDQLANSVRIENPELIGYSIAQIDAEGWYGNGGGTRADFAGGYLEGGASSNFDLTLAETGEVVSNISFEALISYDAGDTFESCGSVSLQVVPAPVAPTISGVNLTVGNSSATLSWNTNLTATGRVNYGTTSGYGSSVVTDSGVTHTAGLTSLSPSTQYHYQIQVTSEGGTTSTADATFTTSAASVTTTTTTTVTNTVTTTNTQTVNQTVILADKSKPTVNVSTKLLKTYKEAPIVEGKVVDTGAINAGIAKIQYSIDDGKNWLLVDESNGSRSASFNFVPEIYDDGNYVLLVKATDLSGNTGVSSKQTLVIDRLPPRIIHSLWRVGPIVLNAPYTLLPGVTTNVSIQAIGGVIELSLIINDEVFKFNKNSENGLWEGEVVIGQSEYSDYQTGQKIGSSVMVRARDGGDNKIEEEIGNISQVSDLVIQPESKITVYKFDETTGRFKIWNGAVYGQNNPEMGKFDWFLPTGRYFVKAKQKGYQNGVSQIFEVENSEVVSIKTSLDKLSFTNFWRSKNLVVSHTGSVIPRQEMELKGKTIKWVEESKFIGKDIKLHIIPSWDPRVAGLLAGLTSDDLVVLPGSNQSSVDMLKLRGGYKAIMVADPDGVILSDIQGVNLPISLQINRRGMVAE